MQPTSSTPLFVLAQRRTHLFGGAAGLAAAALATVVMAQAPAAKASKPDAAPATAPETSKEAGKPKPVTVSLTAEQRALLFKALSAADQDGFEKNEFMSADVGQMLNSQDKAELARGQEQLVNGVIRYARAQHGLRSFKGGDWPKEWALRPQAYDAERDFAFAVRENKVQEWLNGLPPPYARYRVLKTALASLRAQPAPAPKTATAPKSSKAKKGSTASASAESLSREEQLQSVIANMERWRWMPRQVSPDRVEVNTAAGMLQTFQGGQATMAMKAVAGKAGDETPMLTSSIDSIVFNPPWRVPKSIANDELYPKNKRNPGYFKREGFVQSKESESGLMQKPGPKNALGQIKFDFKNAFAVYLHDTPAQSGFDRQSRNASHGCVRVEKPIDLAVILLQGKPEGSPEAIQQLIGAADAAQASKDKSVKNAELPDLETKRVEMAKAMPVFLLYWTAYAVEGGRMEFKKDIYGWDKKLVQLLAAGRREA